MAADFVPTDDMLAAAMQLDGNAGPAFAALFMAVCQEPSAGVTIISQRGRVLFGNVQAARIFHGSEESARHMLGKYWHDYMPVEWVRERLMILRNIMENEKPVLLRTVWRDYQQFTWIYPISEAMDGTDRLFMTITRRIANAEQAERLASSGSDFEFVQSGVIRLAALGALSSRELQVLALLGKGQSTHEAAAELKLSEKTVENHRAAIYLKLGINDRAELLEIAARAGLTMQDAEKKRL